MFCGRTELETLFLLKTLRDMNRLKFSSDSEPLHPQSVTLSVQRTTLWRPEACGVGPLPPLGILWFPSVLQLEQQLEQLQSRTSRYLVKQKKEFSCSVLFLVRFQNLKFSGRTELETLFLLKNLRSLKEEADMTSSSKRL
ncbi:unnamed protein product [Pleuronectes platessa]|uniref:Uncharacterized protein n=1 Tax=Pleuronectes platessa TaxID=8262 RepID=A0A9N7UTG4_PLEPL|nr:unnamed protein product [Pleuronectes platessa]